MNQKKNESVDRVLYNRWECLCEILEQHRSKRDLDSTLEYSRSTLDRAINDLAEEGLIIYKEGVWKPTPFGKYSFECRAEYLNHIGKISDSKHIINNLNLYSPIKHDILFDAKIHEIDPQMPNSIIQEFVNKLKHSNRVVGATPSIMTGYAEEYYQSIKFGERYQLELILPPELFEKACAEFPKLTDEMDADKSVSIFTAPIEFNIGFWILDSESIWINVYTSNGHVCGAISNDTDISVDWGRKLYENIKNSEPDTVVSLEKQNNWSASIR